MIGLYSLVIAGRAVKKSGLPAGRKIISAGKTCVGVAVRGACLPYSVPIACIRAFGTSAGSIATYGLDAACNIVSEVPLMGQGNVLADLSEEDLKDAYLQLGLDFQVSKWMWLELQNQDLIQRAEHASARRIQRWYRELKRRNQYEKNIAAQELRQQGKYLLQKVRTAEEHSRQQERLLTATQQMGNQLEQQLQEQEQQLQEQQKRVAKESDMKSAQLAQQDAELAAAKQKSASHLAAHQELERAARDRSDQLQQQLAQRGTDLREAQAQCVKLQEDLTGKCGGVTAEKQEQAALQKANHASVKVQELEMKSAQQDAELAAAKQKWATHLAAHQDSERAAKIRLDQLQQQLARRDIDLLEAKAQCLKLQEDLTVKCGEMTAEKLEQAALQRAHHASEKAAEDTSAQLQQQLARMGTDLSSAEQELARLGQELSQAQQAKLEAIKEHSIQLQLLQKQLDQKVTELVCLQNLLPGLHAELGRMSKAKEAGMEQMGSLKSQLRAALADRNDAIQELSERRNKMEGRAAKSQGRGQGLAARLAVSGTSLHSNRSSRPSSPATPLNERPKGRSGVFTRLGPVLGPTSQASSDQGSASCGGVSVLHVPGEPDMPPGFGIPGGVLHAPGEPDMPPGFGNPGGVLHVPGESDMPPGFGRSLSASTGKGKGPMRTPYLNEVFGDSFPLVKQMVPKLVGLAKQLGKLHEDGLVHQAVHQQFVLVGQEGDWQFAELDKAAPKNSSLDKSMVYDGTEAPEMAQQLRQAGYYYPNPKQDMWGVGLLLFSVFKGKGQLPHEHEKAIQEGNTLLFASKLCSQRKYTQWKEQVEGTLEQGQVNLHLVKIVMGCLRKDPEERLTAAEVLVALGEFSEMKGWCI